jgi:predicted DNA-binding transcriptional regulator AlpA
MKTDIAVPSLTRADDPLLTPEEVSELLTIPTKTLANWRCARTGPLALRVGAHVRYRQSDVLSWLDERVVEARHWMAD